MKNDVNVHSNRNKQKNLEKICFCWHLERSMTKIAGSGSISQRHGSVDPDPTPYQNVIDPQQWEPLLRIHTNLGLQDPRSSSNKLAEKTFLYTYPEPPKYSVRKVSNTVHVLAPPVVHMLMFAKIRGNFSHLSVELNVLLLFLP
jgi:hypothetical protein